jgi:sugar transferase EpsL
MRTGPDRYRLKRPLDVAVAAAGLVVMAVPMALIAAGILVTMGRPVLFAQTRPGLHGQPFTIYKFRTMRHGAGTDAERLTRLGRFLRATSLDELPELNNVLRGDMSLVGPRPLLMDYLDRYTPTQARRHEVRPGITGLAQVAGRNALDWPTRLALDVEYVDRQSLRLDLAILARTVVQVVRREGISQPGHATVEYFQGQDEG